MSTARERDFAMVACLKAELLLLMHVAVQNPNLHIPNRKEGDNPKPWNRISQDDPPAMQVLS